MRRIVSRLVAAALLLATVPVPVPAPAQVAIPTGSPLDPDLAAAAMQAQERARAQAAQGSAATQTAVPVPSSSPGYQPARIGGGASPTTTFQNTDGAGDGLLDQSRRMKAPPEPGEFETFVAQIAGRSLPRYGQDLLLPSARDFARPATATIPPDYLMGVGDTIAISLKGSVEGSVERTIDTSGNIFLPQVGTIRLAGVRFADVRDRISAAIGIEYRDYGVNVELRELRGIRVFVTGFANNPGSFTVSSLSTMANAVFQAGGPAAGGSFRSVKLYRDGREIADLDLYDLLRGGDRLGDVVLRNEDVLFIPPAGEQVAVIGSVQAEAIYEMKPGETLARTLALAGGANVLADRERVIVYRTSDTSRPGPREVPLALAAATPALGGDIVQVLSQGSLAQPMDRQSVLVRLEGEVRQPGNYFVAPGTPMQDVLAMAGGLTPRAYPFGTRLERASVRAQQREGFREAIDQLEMTIAAAPLTAGDSQDAARSAAELASARAVLDSLRKAEPDGRVVMAIAPTDTTIPGTIALENNDRVFIPPRATTVGVFGAVYRPASFFIDGAPARVGDYVQRAGGTQRAADAGRIFVVRANGQVLTRKDGAMSARALPGDVVFVPVRTRSSNFWSRLRDISTIVFQLGVTAAAVTQIGR